jgi:hypothetical protein
MSLHIALTVMSAVIILMPSATAQTPYKASGIYHKIISEVLEASAFIERAARVCSTDYAHLVISSQNSVHAWIKKNSDLKRHLFERLVKDGMCQEGLRREETVAVISALFDKQRKKELANTSQEECHTICSRICSKLRSRLHGIEFMYQHH